MLMRVLDFVQFLYFFTKLFLNSWFALEYKSFLENLHLIHFLSHFERKVFSEKSRRLRKLISIFLLQNFSFCVAHDIKDKNDDKVQYFLSLYDTSHYFLKAHAGKMLHTYCSQNTRSAEKSNDSVEWWHERTKVLQLFKFFILLFSSRVVCCFHNFSSTHSAIRLKNI